MIWDASDANPLHRRLPAEVVSRRTYPTKKRDPEAERVEDVVVDIRDAVALRPEARVKWLLKACKQVTEGRSSSTELYNIVVSRRFASGLSERILRKLIAGLRQNLELFSDKQRRTIVSSDCPLILRLREISGDARWIDEDVGPPDELAVEETEVRIEERPYRSFTDRAPQKDGQQADGERHAAGGIESRTLGETRQGAVARQPPQERVGAASVARPQSFQAPRSGSGPQVQERESKWQAAEDDAALRRQVAGEEWARREAARKEEKKRKLFAEEEAGRRQEAEQEAARLRKLEDEADSIFMRAIAPQPVALSGDHKARRSSRSVSGAARGGSRSISSRTARKRQRRADRNSRRERSWPRGTPDSAVLTGSRAIFLNRNYQEDLPHLPRPMPSQRPQKRPFPGLVGGTAASSGSIVPFR